MTLQSAQSDTARVEAAVAHIREGYDGPPPRVVLVLGSGLLEVAAGLAARAEFRYTDVPDFPQPTIEGHAGRLAIGRLCGLDVAVLSGREHYYERGRADAMATALRALQAMGARDLLMTNAVGSLHHVLPPGSLVLMSDHINLSGANPLVGSTFGGSPFIDMTNAYDATLRSVLQQTAAAAGVRLREGVYACFSGPSFETAAEIRAARVLGADTVGMSVVAETIIARHAGLRVAAISVVTNFAAGIASGALGHQQTMDAATEAAPRLRDLVESFLRRMAPTLG